MNPAGRGPRPELWLSATIRADREHFAVTADLTIAAGEVVALLGPNGAGKSTILGVIAGLTQPDSGTVTLAGQVLTRAGKHVAAVAVPPEQRRIGLMGQDPLLFPHLTALENVAFGPRAQGRPRSTARASAHDWLDRLGLVGLADRRPHQLSGGQRQRVALARALAAEPLLLLLDEPLGALDAETAPEIRQVLRTHLRDSGTTSILVTHEVLDAAVIADRAVVLERGVVVDDGAVAAVLAAPRSSFGAALAGLNMVQGISNGAQAGGAGTMVAASGVVLAGIAAQDLRPGEAAAALFRPAAVGVFGLAPGGSPRNSWAATIGSLQPGSGLVRLRTSTHPLIAADLTPAAVAELGLTTGAAVYLTVKATEVDIHPR